jgi:hypothetical protein
MTLSAVKIALRISRLATLGMASTLAWAAIYCERSEARPAAPFAGINIDRLMMEFGTPNSVGKTERGANVYHWQFEAKAEFRNDGNSRRTEELFCNVTVITSRRGAVTQVKTEVSNVAAGIYAAVGAFGRLCTDKFGMKSLPQPKHKRQIGLIKHAPLHIRRAN